MIRLGWVPDWKGRTPIRSGDDRDVLRWHIDNAIQAGVYALDTETTGLNVLDGARMFLYSLSYEVKQEDIPKHANGVRSFMLFGKKVHVASVAVAVLDRHTGDGRARTGQWVLDELTRLTTSPHTGGVMFHAKFDAKVLWADGVPLHNLQHDAMLDMYVLDPGFGDSLPEVQNARKRKLLAENAPLPRGLKELCALLLGWQADERDEVTSWLEQKFGKDKKKWKYAALPFDLVGVYACGDTERTLALSKYTAVRLAERDQLPIAKDETQVTLVVAEMELNGIRVNLEAAARVRAEQATLGQAAHDEMVELTGLAGANFNSDEVLISYAWPSLNRQAELLPGGKAYPVPQAWDADALLPYAAKKRGTSVVTAVPEAGIHGKFCKALLTWRGSERIIGTYLDPWVTHHGRVDEPTGELRIHPELLQDGTDTGRFSSKNPNLQNVPPEARVMSPSAGYALLLLDYSQLEFRVFAHYAKGEVLDAYQRDPLTDFHQTVADMLSMDRKPAKNINFGMLYGMGREKLIKNLCGLSEQEVLADVAQADETVRQCRYNVEQGRLAADTLLGEAQQRRSALEPALQKVKAAAALYDQYQRKFPRAKQLSYDATGKAKQRGWIKNLFGRRRYLTEQRAHVALNTVIQGGAADIVKRAMLRAKAVIDAFNEKHPDAMARMLLQIHDELVFEVKECYAKELSDLLIPAMEAEPLLACPLVVEAEFVMDGEIWQDKHDFTEAA